MTSKIIHHKNYTELGEVYQLVLPLSSGEESIKFIPHRCDSGIRLAGGGGRSHQSCPWKPRWHNRHFTEECENVIRQEDETSSESIDTKLVELQKELLKLANSKKDYNGIADEIYRLRELK